MPRETPSYSLDYIRKLYAPQDALLASIDETLKRMNIHMHLAPDEAKLLQMLIKLHKVKTIVEVGTLAGYSAIWMARILPEDGHIDTIGKDKNHNAMAKHFFDQSEVKHKITLLEGDAHEMLPTLNGKAPFDMIFIDADKISYPNYLDWAETHVRKDGLIVADNTLLFDTIGLDAPPPDMAPTTWHNMRAFNARLANPANYFSTMIATPEGMTVAVKL